MTHLMSKLGSPGNRVLQLPDSQSQAKWESHRDLVMTRLDFSWVVNDRHNTAYNPLPRSPPWALGFSHHNCT